MSIELLRIATGAGVALVALWVLVRFPALGPAGLGKAIVHVLVAFVLAFVLAPLATGRVMRVEPLVAYLAISLPALVYLFVAWGWAFRAIQRLAAAGR